MFLTHLQEKKDLDASMKPAKDVLAKKLEVQQVKKFRYPAAGIVVEKVQKLQQRKPTLKMVYDAIVFALGNEALNNVKEKVDQLRNQRKQAASKSSTLSMVKTGELRKRKDENTLKPKRKFLRRKAAEKRCTDD